MKEIIRFLLGIVILYLICFLFAFYYKYDTYTFSSLPLDPKGTIHTSDMFPCIEHPHIQIKVFPAEVNKIRNFLFLKMDWGVIDEKVYKSFNIRFYGGYRQKTQNNPFYYSMSLDGKDYKLVGEELKYIGRIGLNREYNVFVRTCYNKAMPIEPKGYSVRFYYNIRESTFYTAFKLLINLTFWSFIIWLAFGIANNIIKKKVP